MAEIYCEMCVSVMVDEDCEGAFAVRCMVVKVDGDCKMRNGGKVCARSRLTEPRATAV